MGEQTILERKNATYPNKGCLWCPNNTPPLFMYRVVATKLPPWEGPFCSKHCFVQYKDDKSLRGLYVHTLWPEGQGPSTIEGRRI